MRTRHRTSTALITAGAVLLTAATTVIVLHGHAPHALSQRAARPQAAPPAAANPSAAPRPASPAVIDTAGLRWAAFHGMQLPVSTADGPRDIRGGLASGFTRTPNGALLAAVNIGVRTAFLWGPGIYRPTIRRQVTGPDQAALLAAQDGAYQQMQARTHVTFGLPVGRGYAAEAAYRMITYTPAAATFDVVAAGPGPDGVTVLTSTRIEVAWRGADWRVIAPPGGDWENVATRISSLTGYTNFPGEG